MFLHGCHYQNRGEVSMMDEIEIYDPCVECREHEDDYFIDEDGDWMLRCYECPLRGEQE